METQNIEYKLQWRDEFLKEICGFANGQGGILYIGVNDNGEVVGVDKINELLEMLPNKVLTTMGIVVAVNLLEKDNLQYLEVRTEAHPYPINYKGSYYLRSGSTTQELKNNALNQFLLEKRGKTWDSVPQPYLDINDLDEASLHLFRKIAIRSQRMTETDLDGTRAQLLDRLHLTEGVYLKRAAALLFHSDPEKYITGACVKIGYFRTNTDLLYQDEIHGSLFHQVQQTIDLLTTKYMKSLIRYEDLQRIDELPIPRTALREALLNAIIHKFYGSGNPIQISVYEDKLMIYNAAVLPQNWTIETLLGKHNSEPANPDVANVFFRAGEIEAWGRGIERIVEACEAYGCPAPKWKLAGNGIWTVFYYKKSGEPLNEPLSDNNESKTVISAQKPSDLTENRSETVILEQKPSFPTPLVRAVYECICSNPKLKYRQLERELDVSESTILRAINWLKINGYINKDHSKINGQWQLTN